MGRNDSMWNHLGRIRIEANLQRHPATFPYRIFLHRWSFCIDDLFAFVFVLSVAVIVRFAIESFCSTFSCLFCDWNCSFYNDHRSFLILICSMNINRLFCQNVFFTLSAAHMSSLLFPLCMKSLGWTVFGLLHDLKGWPDRETDSLAEPSKLYHNKDTMSTYCQHFLIMFTL